MTVVRNIFAVQQYRAVSIPAHLVKCALLMLMTIGTAVGQTTIVALRNSTELVAGSDSLARGGSGSNIKMSVCKIHKLGHMFWAFAGVVGDYGDIISKARTNGGTIRGTVNNLALMAPPILEKGVAEYRRNFPKGYEHLIYVRALKFVFFGTEKEVPVAAAVVFHIEENATHAVKVSSWSVEITDSPECPGVGNLLAGIPLGLRTRSRPT
ncbi:MAG: hypothetical protein WB729_14810 [Candidatus Sulfotelmatobacter sp.]